MFFFFFFFFFFFCTFLLKKGLFCHIEKRKNLLPVGGKCVPFRVDPFQNGFDVHKIKQEVTNGVKSTVYPVTL